MTIYNYAAPTCTAAFSYSLLARRITVEDPGGTKTPLSGLGCNFEAYDWPTDSGARGKLAARRVGPSHHLF